MVTRTEKYSDKNDNQPEQQHQHPAYMSKFCNLLVLLVGFLVVPASAGQLTVGDVMPAITANDQHGVPFVLTTNIQTLLVATEMDCSKAANRQLAAQAAGFLDKHNAAFLMDIHSMPWIARWFAIPKMKKYPQRIVFIDSPKVLTNFPSQTNRVAVISLNAGCIRRIGFWDPANEPVEKCFQ